MRASDGADEPAASTRIGAALGAFAAGAVDRGPSGMGGSDGAVAGTVPSTWLRERIECTPVKRSRTLKVPAIDVYKRQPPVVLLQRYDSIGVCVEDRRYPGFGNAKPKGSIELSLIHI